MPITISEPELRQAARVFLMPRLETPVDILVDELCMPDGGTRVDLALINGHVEAFELKSDHDSLRRLPTQVEGYAPYFDRITLITTCRFSDKVVPVIPNWWGILVAVAVRGKIALRWQRRAKINPDRNFEKQCHFLWKEDLIQLSRIYAPNAKGRYAMAKHVLASEVTAQGVSRRLKSDMRTLLKARIAGLAKLR